MKDERALHDVSAQSHDHASAIENGTDARQEKETVTTRVLLDREGQQAVTVELRSIREEDKHVFATALTLAAENFGDLKKEREFIREIRLTAPDGRESVNLLKCFKLPEKFSLFAHENARDLHHTSIERTFVKGIETQTDVGVVGHELGHAEQEQTPEGAFIGKYALNAHSASTIVEIADKFGLREILPGGKLDALRAAEVQKVEGMRLCQEALERLDGLRGRLRELRVGRVMTLLFNEGKRPGAYDTFLSGKEAVMRKEREVTTDIQEAEMQYDLDAERERYLEAELSADGLVAWKKEMEPLRAQVGRAVLDYDRGLEAQKTWARHYNDPEMRLITQYPLRLLERDATTRALAAFDNLKFQSGIDCTRPYPISQSDIDRFDSFARSLVDERQRAEFQEIVDEVMARGLTIERTLRVALLTYNATDKAMERLYVQAPNRKNPEDIARELSAS